jgi:hypothetical protein
MIRHKEKFEKLKREPNEKLLIDFLEVLSSHAFHSTISLKELKYYIHEFEVFYSKHPELLHTKYLLNFSKAIMQVYIGNSDQFHVIIEQTKQELKENKRYREVFHLNLLVCHFLPTVSQFKETKKYFYENEKLLLELKQSGIKDFEGFETIQLANSFGIFFKRKVS